METFSVTEWIDKNYPNRRPKKTTVWKWIRRQEIRPLPVRIGRAYRIDSAAQHHRGTPHD